MRFDVITIFPEAFGSYINASILGRAQKNGIIKINLINLRDFAIDKHRTVDVPPYGGGPGMVLKIEPIYKAVNFLSKAKLKKRIILFSAKGEELDQKKARALSKYKQLILICGRYEGVDQRVAKYIVDEEISVGDYVLSGGELPTLILIEAVSRYITGVLGKKESLEEIKGSYPVYTRPEIFITNENKLLKVPKVLLSGNHKKIEEWRKNNAF